MKKCLKHNITMYFVKSYDTNDRMKETDKKDYYFCYRCAEEEFAQYFKKKGIV